MNIHANRVYFILLLCLLASCGVVSADNGQNEETDSQRNADGIESECVRTIERHVAKTRAWDRSAYDIAPEQLSPGVRGFSIMNKSDSFVTEGGRKSFHADLDMTCSKVVRELKYQ
jgi:hypothetical protein